MSKTVAIGFCVIFLLQTAFGTSNYPLYRNVPYARTNYHGQLVSRINAVPVVSQMQASQNVRNAGAQISRGSELFSFEMFNVSPMPFDRFLKEKKKQK